MKKKLLSLILIVCACLTLSTNVFAWSAPEYKVTSSSGVDISGENVLAYFKVVDFYGKIEYTLWNLSGAPEGTKVEVVESCGSTPSYIPYSYGWSFVSRRPNAVFAPNGAVIDVSLATIEKKDKTAPTAGTTTNSTNGAPVIINRIVVGPSIPYATYKVFVNNVADSGSGVKNVDFYTWTEANGQDELVKTAGIYDAVNNRWYAEVNTLDHKSERGNYITHVYAGDNAGNYGFVGGLVTVVK